MPRPWLRLEHSLALLDGYLHPLLGARDFPSLKELLGEVPEGYDADGRSYMATRIIALQHLPQQGVLPAPRLAQADIELYDDNIKRHLDLINAARPATERIVLKYFQYLALFYTEHFLHRYFLDNANLLADLNTLLPAWSAAKAGAAAVRSDPFPAFIPADLTKLAYWMATGSGKTLLLHVNYLQFLHYHRQAGARPLDNILLITPNAGLSDQHLEEFARSGIPAQRFRSSGSASLQPNTVQVLEITKLSGKAAGQVTVHVDSFEGNNLVFVDEGHRGASGDVWIGLRDKLAADGFTFEYSATFGEAFNKGSRAEDVAQRQSYGKAIIFDYSYRYFYGDGYGKEYDILNLPQGYEMAAYGDLLLLANLLAFYEQLRLYAQAGPALRPYHIERPLLVLAGHSVLKGKTESQLNAEDKTSLADVLNMVRFLGRVTSNAEGWVVRSIDAILAGASALRDERGRDIFAGKLASLRNEGQSAGEIYADMLRRVFHTSAPGALFLANLRDAPGELGLRAGESGAFFGVINIGDDVTFLKLAREKLPDLPVETEALTGSLFATINNTDSRVNMLIGAKKFIEGWNSWRVSSMGLLNVGRSEGSEIVQMFGRGVRLKGLDFSLKRSGGLPGTHPAYITALETLNIFSINGDYLADFRKALEREGIADYEEFEVPLQYGLFDVEQPSLFSLRVQPGFQFAAQPAFSVASVDDAGVIPTIDLRPRLQAVSSHAPDGPSIVEEQAVYLEDWVLDLLDWDRLYAELLAWRRQRGYTNLLIARDVPRRILVDRRYILYAPPSAVRPASFADVVRVQATALTILKKYAERFYGQARKRGEMSHLEYEVLDRGHANLRPVALADGRPGYVVRIERQKPDLVQTVADLIAEGQRLYQQDVKDLPNVYFDRHLYQPLLAEGVFEGSEFKRQPAIRTVPVALNHGEARLPRLLRDFLKQNPGYLGNRRLYLLRNQSRGKGIGFFETDGFYPDFILWVLDGVRQRIVFIDPKGLLLLKPNNFDNPKIQLYRTIQPISARLANPDVTLDAYLVSEDNVEQVRPNFGNLHHTDAEFEAHHILFPGDRNLARKIIG